MKKYIQRTRLMPAPGVVVVLECSQKGRRTVWTRNARLQGERQGRHESHIGVYAPFLRSSRLDGEQNLNTLNIFLENQK